MLHTEEVTGSNPVSPTIIAPSERPLSRRVLRAPCNICARGQAQNQTLGLLVNHIGRPWFAFPGGRHRPLARQADRRASAAVSRRGDRRRPAGRRGAYGAGGDKGRDAAATVLNSPLLDEEDRAFVDANLNAGISQAQLEIEAAESGDIRAIKMDKALGHHQTFLEDQ